VPQHQPVDLGFVDDLAAARIGHRMVMVADHPDEAVRRGQRAQPVLFGQRQALAAARVVETVAEAPDLGRIGRRDRAFQRRERRRAVVGRQHLAEAREPARLLEMQIGDDQRTPRGPEQRAVGQRGKLMAGERKGNHFPSMP
jgi:hypothetical protein